MNHSFKAFLFDLDGTLVDSISIVEKGMRAWCKANAVEFTAVEEHIHSMRAEEIVKLCASHLDPLEESKNIETFESLSVEGMPEIPGARAFITQLPKELWAVATSSSIISARPKLQAVNLPIPDVLITAESVQQGKPHPEAYILAASQLGFTPADCLAFEDTKNGATSALNAGCKVITVGNLHYPHPNVIGNIKDYNQLKLTVDISSPQALTLEILN